jgi:hypothetical protein
MRRWLLGIGVALMVLPGCKKGEEDPFFTLRSRKQRLTGSWELETYERNLNVGKIRQVTFSSDDGLTYLFEDSSQVSRAFTWTISFNNDGEYRSEEREEFPADSSSGDQPFTYITEQNGAWKFTGGNDVPNRSQLILLVEEIAIQQTDLGSNIQIETFSDPIEGKVYTIDRLSHEELWLSYAVRRATPFTEELDSLVVKFRKDL